MNAFRFAGKLEFNKLDSKNPYIREGKTKNGADYKTFSFSVVPTKNNRAYVESFGMVEKAIKTKDTEGNDIEVAWEHRKDPEVIKKVAYYKRNSIKLNGTYYEFISVYDFNEFALEHLEELKSHNFVVTGKMKLNVYNGKTSYRYQVQSIREVSEEEEFTPGLVVRFDSFYRASDIDLDRWDKEKEIAINAFTYQYIEKKDNKDVYKYVPTTYYINLANETNEKRAAFFLKQFGIEDNKIKIKKDAVVSLPVRCNFINGSEEVPFNEKCLTDNQREMIEFGLKTLDDFKPAGKIYGEKIVKYFCIDADLRGDYANGCKTEQITAEEFENEIFAPAAKEIKADPNAGGNVGDDIEALFG